MRRKPRFPAGAHALCRFARNLQDGGLTKRNGLLKRALDKAGCALGAAIDVGDSVECDIVPAHALGVCTIFIGDPSQAPEGVEAAATLADLRALISQKAEEEYWLSRPAHERRRGFEIVAGSLWLGCRPKDAEDAPPHQMQVYK